MSLLNGSLNRGGFSWRRFIGLSGLQGRLSRRIGIPLSRSGRERKLGAIILRFIFGSHH